MRDERGKDFPGNCASVSEEEDLIQAWGKLARAIEVYFHSKFKTTVY